MSQTKVTFHRAADVAVKAWRVGDTNWVELTFTDDAGHTLDVVAFTEDTQAILAGLARGEGKAPVTYEQPASAAVEPVAITREAA